MWQQLQHGAGGREKLRSRSSSAVLGKEKNKNRGGRDAFVFLMWSLKGRNISCSVEPIMSCDLLLQGGQFFSSPLVAKYLIVIITTGRKKFY